MGMAAWRRERNASLLCACKCGPVKAESHLFGPRFIPFSDWTPECRWSSERELNH